MPSRSRSIAAGFARAAGLLVALLLLGGPAATTHAQDPGWPREIVKDGARLVYYQPQVDDWKDFTDLDFRFAVSVTPKGGKTVLGVVQMHAKTDVDVHARTVLLHDLAVTGAHFPSLDAAAAEKMTLLARTFLAPDKTVTISLDRLAASVEKPAAPAGVQMDDAPPVIFTSEGPAILVQIDGEPVFAKIAGASLGLAVATKITLYVIALPWLVALAVHALRSGRPGVRALLVVAAVAGALNVGHGARQARLWWSIAPAATAPRTQADAVRPRRDASGIDGLVAAARAHAPAGGGMLRYVNAAMSPALLLSNVVRNVGLHAAVPWESGRAALDGAVRAVHEVLGVSPIDARTTYPSGRAFRAPDLSRHEDVAPNPLQLALALCAAAVLLLRRRLDDTARAGALVACAFVLFAAVFKWQPWHTRLHLPILVLAAPVVAATLLEGASRRGALVLGAALVLAAIPWVVANEMRPVLGPASVLRVPRADQYFTGRPNLREPYLRAVAWLRERDCRDVGLVVGGNEWEYPLWPLLGDADRPARIRHVNVANESRFAAPADPSSAPCAVLAIGVPDAGDELVVDGRAYRQGFTDGPVRGFVP